MNIQNPIIVTLHNLMYIFEEFKVTAWVAKTKEILDKVGDEVKINDKLIKEFIGAGMGSSLDLYLCKQNGHAVSFSNETFANQRLNNLIEQLYEFQKQNELNEESI